jgi:glycosyltransferase involved in cell wall biosynthesis
MSVLIIIPYDRYFSDISSHLSRFLSKREDRQRAMTMTVTPPYYSVYAKTKKLLNKRQLVMVMLFNFVYFIYRFVIRKRQKHDVILLAGNEVVIPYLSLVKILPFINAEKNIIVMSFFLHSLGEKKVVQKLLCFLLKGKKIILATQSNYEVGYYSKLMDKTRIVHYPFCQYEVPFSDDYGKGEEYIFAGGYTNRDYDCLFQTARVINRNFIFICSRLNQIDMSKKPDNVKLLIDTSPREFNSYLKNAKIVIIPLKEKTGSSGQMVALAAMLFKKPIIYTNIDSVSQYFEDGVSGISYEINNSGDLAGKINRLLSDERLCEKLGANAYKKYSENFHISKYCEFLAELILK